MAFTVTDFQDLLQLLRQNPEWQEQLRAVVLSRELLELPALFRQLTERVDTLAQRMDTLAQRVDELAEAQVRTEQRLDALTQRVNELSQQVSRLAAQVATLNTHVGSLRGEMLEIRYERHVGAYFGRHIRNMRVIHSQDLADMLDEAEDRQVVDDAERETVLRTDLVLSGRRRDGTRAEIYLAIEISAIIDSHDVERAIERAAVLTKLGRPGIPVVAGEAITDDAVRQADAAGVWRILDGRTDGLPAAAI